jgi:p21-activated kinase 1
MCRELADGEPPFMNLPLQEAFHEITTNGPPEISRKDSRSPQFLDFLSKCLDPDPAKRATAPVLLKHPFLRTACDMQFITPLLRLAKRSGEAEEMDSETR